MSLGVKRKHYELAAAFEEDAEVVEDAKEVEEDAEEFEEGAEEVEEDAEEFEEAAEEVEEGAEEVRESAEEADESDKDEQDEEGPIPRMDPHQYAEFQAKRCLMKTKINNKIKYLTLDSRFQVYTKRPARIENICGQFKNRVDRSIYNQVCMSTQTCMGPQLDVYNINGNACLLNRVPDYPLFKGCRNIGNARGLAHDMGIDDPLVIVHMSVASACMGILIDVRPNGLMSHILRKLDLYPYHMVDVTNSIRFRVSTLFPFTKTMPRSNDWTITTRGVVVIRMVWNSLEWTAEIEAEYLKFCDDHVRMLRREVDAMQCSV